jgi:dihydroorotate dehydrogenase (NAD+) catalytic subunit
MDALELGSLKIDPPLFNASGAFDVTSEDSDWRAPVSAALHLGAYVTKSVTRHARTGSPEPRVAMLDEGTLVNAVGLKNPGIDGVSLTWADTMRSLERPVFLSVTGTIEELVEIVERAESFDWIYAYELNLACPNTGSGAPLVAGDPDATARHVASVRERTKRPIVAKLGPATSDIGAVARAAEAAGADGITAVNTIPVRAYDDDGESLLSVDRGGMSGTWLHPIALDCVARIAGAVSIPVIGCGGVASPASMRRMFDAGAQAVSVGTAAAIAPTVLAELARALGGTRVGSGG